MKLANFFFLHDTVAHDAASPYQVGNKMFCGSEDIIQKHIHQYFELLLWP